MKLAFFQVPLERGTSELELQLSFCRTAGLTPEQAAKPDDSRESAHKAYIYKDQPWWPIYVSNCIYETYDLGGFASDPLN